MEVQEKVQEYGKPSNFQEISYRIPMYGLDLTEAQTMDDVLKPIFWRHISALLVGPDERTSKARGGFVVVRKMDTCEAQWFFITEVGKGWMKVRPGMDFRAPEIEVPEDLPMKPRWVVGNRTYDVVRNDGTILVRGLQSKETAMQWIQEHLKAIAA